MKLAENSLATSPDELVQSAMDRRRAEVIAWLHFMRDFSQIDVERLIAQAAVDDTFIEAAEAVLKSASRPWAAFEALRDFCVSQLLGEKPATHVGPPRPRHRVTPFSVPMELLRSTFTHQGKFTPGRLRIHEESFVLDVPGRSDNSYRFYVSQDRPLLLTTAWARVVPPNEPLHHRVEIIDQGSCRSQSLLLWALVAEPQPLFLPLSPSSSVEVRVAAKHDGDDPALHVLMSLEGWTYLGDW